MLTREKLVKYTRAHDLEPDKSKLFLRKKHLTDKDIIEIVVPYLREHPEIISLNLEDNQITIRGFAALMEIASLKSLNVSKNLISSGAGRLIAANTSLIELDISNNSLRDQDAIDLAPNTSLITLKIGSCGLRDTGTIALAQNTSIVHLFMGNTFEEWLSRYDTRNNRLTLPAFTALAAKQGLETLDLSYMHVEDAGAAVLATSGSITVLILQDADIEAQGIIALAGNEHILILDVSDNNIGEGGMALAANTSLQILTVSPRMGLDVAKALAANTTIAKLKVISTSEDEEAPENQQVIKILTEGDPVKRASLGREVGIATEVPSLKRIALFKVKEFSADEEKKKKLEDKDITSELKDDSKKSRF